MYALDLGVERDLVAAYMWATLAAAEDAQNAEENLARMAEYLSDEQIAEAERLAAEWRPRKSAPGYSPRY